MVRPWTRCPGRWGTMSNANALLQRAPRMPRRRFLSVTAAAAGLALAPLPGRLLAAGVRDGHTRVWHGVALGADAKLQIHHTDAAAAERLIEQCLAEVRRLEGIFSLYVPDSAISRLNREGTLAAPPLELVELLSRSAGIHARTGGAFDPTVQPLWNLYAGHFAKPGADPAGPAPKAVAGALARVGFEHMDVGAGKIAFARPHMAVTLNGIAQGFITDRVVDVLRQAGLERSLVDMGEIRGIGGRPGGGPWRIGLENPFQPGTVAETIAVENTAVATSGGYGTPLGPGGRFDHLIDPARGGTGSRYASVSVVAPTATLADALSTGMSFLPLDKAGRLAAEFGVRAHFVMPDGTRIMRPAPA